MNVKKILEALNAIVLLFMFIITVLSVVFRSILKLPASWTEGLGQYSFIFLVFIGSAAAMRDEGHITITAVTDHLSPRLQKIFRILAKILILPFVVMFTAGAFQGTKLNWGISLPTIDWMKISYLYIVLFVSGIIMTFYVCMNLYWDLTGKNRSSSTPGGST